MYIWHPLSDYHFLQLHRPADLESLFNFFEASFFCFLFASLKQFSFLERLSSFSLDTENLLAFRVNFLAALSFIFSLSKTVWAIYLQATRSLTTYIL